MLSKLKQNCRTFGRQNVQKLQGKCSKMDHRDAKVWPPGEKKWPRPPISFPRNGGKIIENMYKSRYPSTSDKICARNEQKQVAPERKNGRRALKSWVKECRSWWLGDEKVPAHFGEGSWGTRRDGC
jgi:hypothetical protein